MAIKLAEVEVTQPLPTITDVDGYESVWILIKNQGIALGYVCLEECHDSISPERLAREISNRMSVELMMDRLYRHFIGRPEPWKSGVTGLFEPIPDPSQEAYQPFISVLICTRDRPEPLKDTLDSLLKVDYPHFEVLVIDNHPSDNRTKELVAQYPFRYVLEPCPGLDWARNRGIAQSKGEIIAFIDDDATADSLWLKGIADGFAEPDTMCVTGLVLPIALETKAQELFELAYGGFCKGFRRFYIRPSFTWKYQPYSINVGTGANMAFRKTAFDKIGGFDVAFDVGTVTGGGGDLDMFHRLIKSGLTISYRPEALVFHRHRESIEAFRKQLLGYGISFPALLTKWFIQEPESRFLTLKFGLKWYRWWYANRTIRALRGWELMPLGLIVLEGLMALTGPRAYFRSMRNARRLKEAYANAD